MCSPRQLILRLGGFAGLLVILILTSVVFAPKASAAIPDGQKCPDGLTWNDNLQRCETPVPTGGACPTGSTAQGGVCVGATVPNDGQASDDTCIIAKDTQLRWIACPLTSAGVAFTHILDIIIYSYLTIDTDKIFGANASASGGSGQAFHTVWSNFRALGLGLIVIAGLFMIISEAMGFDFVDAYTIRKTLPRLLIAAIGISISWPLLYFIVTLFNDLGHAVGSIIDTAFSGLAGGDSKVGGGVQWFAVAGAGVAAFTVLQIGGILSFLGTAILALLIGIAVLILRETIIVLAIIISPLAIAAYVLPNTAKFAKFWWDTLIRALVMFPIIVGFIALGRAMSNVTANSGTTGAAITGFILYYLPYFLLPFTLRLAGGLVATIGGIANDKSRGGFDRLKNYRSGKREYNMARLKNGDRWNGSNAMTRGLNSTSARFGVKNFGLGNQGKAAMVEKMSLSAAAHAKSDQGIAAQFNDDLLRAQSYASEAAARQGLQRDFGFDAARANSAITAAKANGGFGQARQIYATKQLAATGTGYDDIGQMLNAVGRASGGSEAAANDMIGAMRGAAKQSGRIDLAGAGHGSMAKAAVKAHNQGITQEDTDKLLVEAARSTVNSDIVRGKPVSTAQLAGALGRSLNGNVNIARSGRLADGSVATSNVIEAAQVDAGQVAAKLANIQSNTRFGHEMGAEALYTGKGEADSPAGIGIAGEVVENIKFVQGEVDKAKQANQASAYRQAYDQEIQSAGFDGVNDPRMDH